MRNCAVPIPEGSTRATSGQRGDAVRQTLDVEVERAHRQIARHRDRGDEVGPVQLAHNGRIGAGGKGVDRGDLGAQVVHEAQRVAAGLHRGDGAGAVVLRGAAQLLQRLHPLHAVPERAADGILDIPRGGAAIGDDDLGLGGAEIGEGLALQRRKRCEAGRDEEEQEQVGGGRMPGKPADHRSDLHRPERHAGDRWRDVVEHDALARFKTFGDHHQPVLAEGGRDLA